MIFKDYAAYYDLLYKDKDYLAEALYIHELIQKNAPGAKSILNLGCGTGNHEFHLAALGYQITGVDLSGEMIQIAENKLRDQPTELISFLKSDIRITRLPQKFDVVISLFHVISYQINNEDLIKTFETAQVHLKDDGVFIFDCWYGPGVLFDLPVVRYKTLENDKLKIHRISEPTMHPNDNIVEVNFKILVHNKIENAVYEFSEKHMMRYFFSPEIKCYLNFLSFSEYECYDWPTSKSPNNKSWFVVFVAKK